MSSSTWLPAVHGVRPRRLNTAEGPDAVQVLLDARDALHRLRADGLHVAPEAPAPEDEVERDGHHRNGEQREGPGNGALGGACFEDRSDGEEDAEDFERGQDDVPGDVKDVSGHSLKPPPS